MKGQARAAYLKLCLSMLIFGTIGLLRRQIPLPSALLALSRGVIGSLFLLALGALRGQGAPWRGISRQAFLRLFLSGAMMGCNWILLFEAYRYTTVAVATVCYYMAPVFVFLTAPLLLGERLTPAKALCCLAALVGAALVSGTGRAGFAAGQELRGVLLALGAAVLYAGVVLMNKTLPDMDAFRRTLIQLAASAVVMLPYACFSGGVEAASLTPTALALTLLAGVLHTGVAYALYFGAIAHVRATTAALFSYIDPLTAVLLSALLLREPFGAAELAGTALILGATLCGELLPEKK